MRREINLIETTDTREAVYDRAVDVRSAVGGWPDVVAQAMADPFDERILTDHLLRYDMEVEGLGRRVLFYG